jgi:transposase
MAPFPRTRPSAYREHPDQTFGRPTLYRQEYCTQVVDKMAEGLSVTAFAGHLRVSVDTVYQWMRLHRDFAEAVARARSARTLWLEQKLLKSRKGAETTAAIFALRNAAPHEWRDLKYSEHTHTVKAEMLTDAQLHAIASGISARDAGVLELEADHTGNDG